MRNEGRAGNEPLGLKQPIDAGLGDVDLLAVGEGHGQLAGTKLGLVESQFEDLVAHVIGNAVPDALGARL